MIPGSGILSLPCGTLERSSDLTLICTVAITLASRLEADSSQLTVGDHQLSAVNRLLSAVLLHQLEADS
jgi:hypothetical protein